MASLLRLCSHLPRTRHRDQSDHLLTVEVVSHRQRAGRVDDANNDVDLLVLNEIACLLNHHVRLALVIDDGQLNIAAADLVAMLLQIETDRWLDELRTIRAEHAGIGT